MDQKLENLLNLSLDASSEERARSSELSGALSDTLELWNIILRFSGSLDEILTALPDPVYAVELLGGYAILTLPRESIYLLSAHPLVQFIEQPKQIYAQFLSYQSASCIPPLSRTPYDLSGQGILFGIADSGLDLSHPAFLANGRTRVLRFWDQIGSDSSLLPPAGYRMGAEYTEEEINARLAGNLPLPPDLSGHGTAVAGIAAGSANFETGFSGTAPKASLVVVRLAPSAPNSFPRTSELMQGINYLAETAIALRMPLVINISLGNTYGSHDGTSLLETYLDTITNLWKITICVGSGNEGNDNGHTAVSMNAFASQTVPFSVSPYETTLSIQLWKSYLDTLSVELISPSGERVTIPARPGPYRYQLEETGLLIYYGIPGPYSLSQELFFLFLPRNFYVNQGVWNLRLRTETVVNGIFHFWMNDSTQRNPSTRFLNPSPDLTLTIPSTAAKCITVGAYNHLQRTYADFSGRGYTRWPVQVKPDLAAPGTGITAPRAGGGFAEFTGTSFACPLAAGAAILLMEWGILRGNDPYLFGEKLKAYLQRSARPIGSEENYPNPRLGYGTLCALDALRTL